MHDASYAMMKMQKEKLPDAFYILDVGSMDINGTYRDLFIGCEYIGIDISPGNNVDLCDFDLLPNDFFDLVISGQTFEHALDDKALMLNIYRKTKPGGHCIIIAPSTGHVHNPPDYRRYTPQMMNELAEYAGYKVVESYINKCDVWNDCVFVGQK